MNPLIENELKNIKIARVPEFNKDTRFLIIKKGIRELDEVRLEMGKFYQIEIDNNIKEYCDKIPPDRLMNVEICDIINDVVKISGTGHNNKLYWCGWLPLKGIKITNVL